MKVQVAQLCLTLCDSMDCTVQGILQAGILELVAFPSPGVLPHPGIKPMSPQLWADSLPAESPGKSNSSGVGSLSLLQGIFLTQELNRDLLHCRGTLYQLSHQGSPRILEWVAYPFSRGSFWPKNRTGASCTAGGFFTSWATREEWNLLYATQNTDTYSPLIPTVYFLNSLVNTFFFCFIFSTFGLLAQWK